MSLTGGTRLGHYEILALIGAGGMGEVYRARDERLRREVALKVLPASFAQDAERLRRFESEAHAASALNHPNIVTVHDVGQSNGTAYMAMELVEGSSLRQLLAAGAMPEKKMLEVAVQIADGLAKAHSAGIVHRDLKPENVMVSRDGFVKLLDFGLAKPFAAPADGASAIPTMAGETQPGTVLGTVGYMSPEQASGRPVDYRSDQFALGSILYEMATGHRAFQKPTGAETLSAIIREEPEPVARVNPRAPAPYRWIVERCLAKDPEDRYASTRDLARDLKSVREHVSEVTSLPSGATAVAAPPSKRRTVAAWLAAVTLVLGLAGGVLIDRRLTRSAPPSFTQLTYRRGSIGSARFAPDGQTILYSARWDGRPMEVFVARIDTPESRPFGLSTAELLSVSPSGEMAVSLDRRDSIPFNRTGTLARIGMTGGGSPKEFLEDILWADWAPDGQTLAVVRQEGGKIRLEFPVGRVLYETAGWVSHPRVSPGGEEVAFLDHPVQGDDSGRVMLVDRSGKRQPISDSFESAQGLCWSPNGTEIFFSATSAGVNRALQAVNRSGRVRVLARGTGTFTIEDVSKTGRALVIGDKSRKEMSALLPGSPRERDFSWLDWSLPRGISDDGQTLLFDETGVGGGLGYSVYVRKSDGSPAVRLGPGTGADLSADGRLALAVVGGRGTATSRLVLYPIGVGEPKTLPPNGLRIDAIGWLPDGRRFVFSGAEPDRGSRLWVQGIDEAKPRAFSPEGYRLQARSPDGKLVAAVGPDRRFYLYPIGGGEPTPISGLVPGDVIGGWAQDGRSVYVRRRGEVPLRVMKLDLATGRKELWKELIPADAAGVSTIAPVLITPDERYYAYSYTRSLGDLYVVDGLK